MLWDTALEIGRKMALGGLEEIKEDVLAEGMELGKVLGRREEMENCRGDMEKLYKWGFMVSWEVGAHEEGEQKEKNVNSSNGMCPQEVPIAATCNIAMQTPSSSTSKPSTCTALTQTASPPCAPAHPIEALIMLSNEHEPPTLNWADDVDAILPLPVSCSPPPCNLSALSTGVMRPFGTLQLHVNCSHSHLQQLR